MGTTHAGGRPLKFKTVKALQAAIDAYFASCWDYKRDMFGNRIKDREATKEAGSTVYIMQKVKQYTVTGLALALGTTRETLMDYEERDKFSDTVKKAKLAIYADTEEALYGRGATGAIFSLKHNYGWTDRSQVESSGEQTVTVQIKKFSSKGSDAK